MFICIYIVMSAREGIQNLLNEASAYENPKGLFKKKNLDLAAQAYEKAAQQYEIINEFEDAANAY